MTSSAIPSDIIAAISAVIGDTARPVALHEPLFSGNENQYVKSCIDDGWVSTVGSFVNRFERDLAEFCGAAHAVVIVNGTCAIHAALLCLGVEPGDEVLIPSLTFVATANAVVHARGVPHFVDVEETSMGIDPVALEGYLSRIASNQDGRTVNRLTGRVIRALVPVHIFGHPCQIKELAAVALKWNLQLLEDATEALGSTQDDRPVGSRNTAVLSFNGNKIITTGGGGAVVTQDETFYRRLKHLTTTAKQSHPWAFLHDEVAYNYRMPNINAALGCAQLEQASRFVAAKRALAAAYMGAFEGMRGARILPSPPCTESNFWLVTLLMEHADEEWLAGTLQALHDVGLLCRPAWHPLHLLPMYRNHPRSDLARTESLARRVISLPSSVRLGLPFLPSGA
jgi:perosamine synthetase